MYELCYTCGRVLFGSSEQHVVRSRHLQYLAHVIENFLVNEL
jgi:hypothetical protein